MRDERAWSRGKTLEDRGWCGGGGWFRSGAGVEYIGVDGSIRF